jgi:hypothetical protein
MKHNQNHHHRENLKSGLGIDHFIVLSESTRYLLLAYISYLESDAMCTGTAFNSSFFH